MKPETQSFYRAAVRRAVAHIVTSLDEALDLTALARAAALSPFHFHRVFRGLVGETPLEIHRRLRLERAASRLVDGNDSVTSIAFEAGYDTHEAFTRAFRTAYGVSPSLFRQSSTSTSPSCGGPRRIEIACLSGIHFGNLTEGSPFTSFIEGESTMDATIEEMPATRLAAVRHRGPYPRISEAFQKLGAIAGSAGLFQWSNAKMIAVYHDDPESTPKEDLRSDACISISEDTALPAGLEELRLPAGRYAMTTYVGPYSGLPDAWARFMGDWLPKSAHRVAEGLSYELYVNNPQTTPEKDPRTDLYLPIA